MDLLLEFMGKEIGRGVVYVSLWCSRLLLMVEEVW